MPLAPSATAARLASAGAPGGGPRWPCGAAVRVNPQLRGPLRLRVADADGLGPAGRRGRLAGLDHARTAVYTLVQSRNRCGGGKDTLSLRARRRWRHPPPPGWSENAGRRPSLMVPRRRPRRPRTVPERMVSSAPDADPARPSRSSMYLSGDACSQKRSQSWSREGDSNSHEVSLARF